jgi:16S rRNA (guanine527-N7)-methyltransferase
MDNSTPQAHSMTVFCLQLEKLMGITLTARQMDQFYEYEQLLLEWNQKINLTAIRDAPGIQTKHFLDSLSLLRVISRVSSSSIIDVGSGAGFPGIPIKIANPNVKLVLIESVIKKAAFCQLVVDKLELSDVSVIACRVEDAARLPLHREKYDFALARAVARMPILAEYLLPLVRLGGHMLAQKGSSTHDETHSAAHAIHLLRGQLENILPVELPGVSDERFIVVVKKVAATPILYPRPAGMPAKKPIT